MASRGVQNAMRHAAAAFRNMSRGECSASSAVRGVLRSAAQRGPASSAGTPLSQSAAFNNFRQQAFRVGWGCLGRLHCFDRRMATMPIMLPKAPQVALVTTVGRAAAFCTSHRPPAQGQCPSVAALQPRRPLTPHLHPATARLPACQRQAMVRPMR